MNVNLSNRWLTTTLAQYDSASQRHVLYVRLNYIYRPGDDLFIVFNQAEAGGVSERAGPLADDQTYVLTGFLRLLYYMGAV